LNLEGFEPPPRELLKTNNAQRRDDITSMIDSRQGVINHPVIDSRLKRIMDQAARDWLSP
jgi:hypothetical protein